MSRYVEHRIVGAVPAAPGWRVVRVLDAGRGWVVCQTVACWLTISEQAVSDDDRVVVPGVVNGDVLWPAHLDDLGARITTAILEPGEHLTVVDLEEMVDEQRRTELNSRRTVNP